MDKLSEEVLAHNESLRKIHKKIQRIEDWSALPLKPMVSVMTATFNHKNYIRDCLDGILMQKTNFDFEIIIKEDKSTDGTREIVQEYQKRYPDRIRLWLCKENLYSQKLKPNLDAFARSKYIARCEGDDYWTDPLKLQKQVDFMEENPDCSMCFHPYITTYVHSNKPDKIPKNEKNGIIKYTPQDIIGWKFIRIATLLFRAELIKEYPKWTKNAPAGDYPLQLILATKGNAGFLAGKPMAVYRRGGRGAWSEKQFGTEKEEQKWRKNRLFTHLINMDLFNEHSHYKYDKIIQKRKRKWLLRYSFYALDYTSRNQILKLLKSNLKIWPFWFIYDSLSKKFWIRFFLGRQVSNSLIRKKVIKF